MEEINSENEDRKPLTNEDFRVLLMTPRHNSNDNQSSKSKSSVSL